MQLNNENPMKEHNFRYEKKFRFTTISYYELIKLLHLSPFLFREIHHQRTVNNIYLDSFEMQSYYDNIDGYSERTKTRIRWYGNNLIRANAPKLEFKKKYGHVGLKNVFNISPFIFKPGFSRDNLMKVFDDSSLPEGILETLRHLRLSLYNKYERQYFISSDGRFRVTLDKDMHYFGLKDSSNYFLGKRSDYGISVMELKYRPEDSEAATNITEQFAFRMTKNSKYVTGVSYFINP